MRAMTPAEIMQVIERVRWAVICTVCPDSSPYAIEATPYRDAEDLCFMINPRGTTRRNLRWAQACLTVTRMLSGTVLPCWDALWEPITPLPVKSTRELLSAHRCCV